MTCDVTTTKPPHGSQSSSDAERRRRGSVGAGRYGPGMALTLGMVTVDTQDARELARWWAEQTGGELDDPYDGWFVTLKGGGLPVMLAFQKVDDPTPGKNKVHLDLTSGDVDAEVDRLVAAGATLVERRGEEGFRWVTMSDPHGNLFDVASAAEATTEYVG